MSKETDAVDTESLEQSTKFYETVIAALIGVNIVIVVQLLQLTTLDLSLKISVYCFAVAIPMSSVYLVVVRVRTSLKFHAIIWPEILAMLLGLGGSIVGLGAIFWHFSTRVGITFIVASVVAIGLIIIYVKKFGEVNP